MRVFRLASHVSLHHVSSRPLSPTHYAPLQVRTNMANTITSIKRLIGTRFNDPAVQTELAGNNFKGVAMADGETGMQVSPSVSFNTLLRGFPPSALRSSLHATVLY